MAKIKSEDKPQHMQSIGMSFAVISKAKQDVHLLEVQAAPEIQAVMASFGPGPHKMPVPGPDGSSKDYIVNFRKDGATYNMTAVPTDSIT